MNKIGEGAISTAYLLDDGKTTMLVGTRYDAFEKYKEIATSMKMVNGKIKSVQIPSNFKIFTPTDEYPLGLATFDFVPGNQYNDVKNTCTEEQKIAIGKKLVEFVNEITTIDCIGDKENEIARANKSISASRELLDIVLTTQEKSDFDNFVNTYNKFLNSRDFCWTHGDLHGENLILNDKNELTGIIDFGNMGYYVPEIEYTWMSYEEPLIYQSMLQHSNSKIKAGDVALIRLAKEIRYFKLSKHWEESKRNEQSQKIQTLLEQFAKSKQFMVKSQHESKQNS